jgi:hypothetical protein
MILIICYMKINCNFLFLQTTREVSDTAAHKSSSLLYCDLPHVWNCLLRVDLDVRVGVLTWTVVSVRSMFEWFLAVVHYYYYYYYYYLDPREMR